MKIAYILNTYPQPSHSFIRRELQALERQGYAIDRIAMRPAEVELVDAGDQAEAAHIARRCARHTHAHFGTNAATVAMLCHAMGGPRHSFTVHGPEEFDAPRALSLPDKITRAAFTVAISSFGRSQLSRLVPHGTWTRISVVHCWIEPAVFAQPAPMPPIGPDAPLRLVAIGRFVEQKGQMMLPGALRLALDRLQTDGSGAGDIHLTLIGDGPLRPALEAGIAEAGLTTHVTLTGWLDEAGVRDQLARAHGLIMPSFAKGRRLDAAIGAAAVDIDDPGHLPFERREARDQARAFVAPDHDSLDLRPHGWAAPNSVGAI